MAASPQCDALPANGVVPAPGSFKAALPIACGAVADNTRSDDVAINPPATTQRDALLLTAPELQCRPGRRRATATLPSLQSGAINPVGISLATNPSPSTPALPGFCCSRAQPRPRQAAASPPATVPADPAPGPAQQLQLLAHGKNPGAAAGTVECVVVGARLGQR